MNKTLAEVVGEEAVRHNFGSPLLLDFALAVAQATLDAVMPEVEGAETEPTGWNACRDEMSRRFREFVKE